MAHGLGTGITTLYDEDGNAYTVVQQGSEYQLLVVDRETTNKLDELIVLAGEIRDLLLMLVEKE